MYLKVCTLSFQTESTLSDFTDQSDKTNQSAKSSGGVFDWNNPADSVLHDTWFDTPGLKHPPNGPKNNTS